jgi:hypothetical protein
MLSFYVNFNGSLNTKKLQGFTFNPSTDDNLDTVSIDLRITSDRFGPANFTVHFTVISAGWASSLHRNAGDI